MLKLSPLIQITKIYREMMDQVIERMKMQEQPLTPMELEEFHQEIDENKKKVLCREKWFKWMTIALVCAEIATLYPYVYGSGNHTIKNFVIPMHLACAVLMLIAVLVMRFVISDAPNMQPNEKAVLAHVFIFPVFTAFVGL